MASNSSRNPYSPPNKRLKAIVSSEPNAGIEELESVDEQWKQRQSIVDSNSMSCFCGICLSDHGKAIRGEINSCEHYFCFVCIVEWAKIESRCPMCKRRFTTIRRPPKDGVFASERIVNVPQRDQVYHPYGNGTVGPFDPYAQVHCSVCQGTADDSLLLLCDLCDTAAHTFCVGFGATVPEGDWFCHDCAILRSEHDKFETDTDGDNLNAFETCNVVAATETNVVISDIVREVDNQVGQPHRHRQVSTLADSFLATKVPDAAGSARTPQNLVYKATGTSARTLHHCRNVHSRIRALRENWNALRSGSLRFPSSAGDSRNHVTGADMPDSSGSSPMNGQQPRNVDDFRCLTLDDRDSYDIEKAWNMMDRAKSIQQARERAKSVTQATRFPFGKADVSKESSNRKSSKCVLKRGQPGTREPGNVFVEKNYRHNCSQMESGNCVSLKSTKQEHSIVVAAQSADSIRNFQVNQEPGTFVSSSPSMQGNICNENRVSLLRKNLFRTSSNCAVEQDRSSRVATPVKSMPHPKSKHCASSSCEPDFPEVKVTSGKGSAGENDEPKSEIQSLVKLNLKILTRDKKLDVDAFKEVARLATHTILAACGLEHPSPGIQSFHGSICDHLDQIQKFRKSTLMPNSCRECFCVFVKDVVNSILSEKACFSK